MNTKTEYRERQNPIDLEDELSMITAAEDLGHPHATYSAGWDLVLNVVRTRYHYVVQLADSDGNHMQTLAVQRIDLGFGLDIVGLIRLAQELWPNHGTVTPLVPTD